MSQHWQASMAPVRPSLVLKKSHSTSSNTVSVHVLGDMAILAQGLCQPLQNIFRTAWLSKIIFSSLSPTFLREKNWIMVWRFSHPPQKLSSFAFTGYSLSKSRVYLTSSWNELLGGHRLISVCFQVHPQPLHIILGKTLYSSLHMSLSALIFWMCFCVVDIQ